ncbi:MAG: hypothetical protein DWI10_09375 [Planctomycetota bacterium]|nr:MAG: hypothetical protein DWI10_09375 [Planctomycetota bacterium]
MFRPGTDEVNVQYEDVLCNFCHQPWDPDDPSRPLIEGHHGSHLCGECLSLAYQAIVHEGQNLRVEGLPCSMCLEQRDDECWRSAEFPDVCLCRRCIKQGATALEKDKEYTWKRPVSANAPASAPAIDHDEESDDDSDSCSV